MLSAVRLIARLMACRSTAPVAWLPESMCVRSRRTIRGRRGRSMR
jgi:hypothetical protein